MAHSIPLFIAGLILGDTVRLREQEKSNNHDIDAAQNSVVSFIKRLVVLVVDVRCDDAAELNGHYDGIMSDD